MAFGLRFLPFLKRVEQKALDDVESEVETFSLAAGQTLFSVGDPADAFYLVRSGALVAFRTGADGRPELIGHIRQGEPIGEMALVEDRPHSASVYALRDCELVRLPKSAFQRLTRKHASLMRELARMMLYRLKGGSLNARAEPKVFALISTSPTIDLGFRSSGIIKAVQDLGLSIACIDGNEDIDKLDQIEAQNDLVLINARLGDAQWAQQAMAKADRIWLLARADARPSIPLLPDDPSPAARLKLIDVIMVHDGGGRKAASPQDWVDAASAARCFHWRQGMDADKRHLARVISGRSKGLVFSGGGSRAYAHIGALRAFRDCGLEFDFYGGASMGGIVSAGAAMGWSGPQLEQRMKAAFVDSNPLADWSFPIISLSRGQLVKKRLKKHFGDVEIADLHRPFFCVSSNLSTGQVVVHRSGKISRAIQASIAIPGILPPVIENNQVLVDGAVFNNFPVQEMKAFHRGENYGCDVTRTNAITASDFIDPPNAISWIMKNGFNEPPPIASLLMRAATVGSIQEQVAVRDEVDVLVLPELDIDLRDWRKFDTAVEAGYRSTVETLQKQQENV